METFSLLLVLCEGNPPVRGGFPTQRPVTRRFGVFLDLRLNKRSHDEVMILKHFPRYWPLWGDFTGHRWFPLTKASDAELWCFLWSAPEPTCQKGDPVSTLLDVILVTSSQRYLGILNSECNISDFHKIIGAATRRFAPSLKPQKIMYRSYKSFNDADFLFDLQCAPFHVMNIFDDADDMAWYTSALLSDIVDSHALVK